MSATTEWETALDALFIHYEAGRLIEAGELCEQFLQRWPDHPDALQYLGLIHFERGDGKQAQALMERAVALAPDDAEAHFGLGNILLAWEQPGEAAASFGRALDLEPEFDEAHANLGSALLVIGDLVGACASFQQALVLAPELGTAHYGLARTLHLQGLAAKAVASYRRALELGANGADIHCYLGSALLNLGRPAEAENSLRRALDLQPQLAETHCSLGIALKQLGRLEEAERSYRQAIALRADFAEAHGNLGNVLTAWEKWPEAVDSYQRAVALRPDHADEHFNLGNAYRSLGRSVEAAESYQRAIALRPHHALALNNLGYLLLGENRLQEAEQYCRQAAAFAPDQAQVHTNLAVALERQGRTEEAIASFEHAYNLDPEYTPALWGAKLCLPVLYADPAEIAGWRRRFEHNLDELIAATPLDTAEEKLRAFKGANDRTNFYLAYQGHNDLELQRRYGTFVHQIAAVCHPQWSVPLPIEMPLSGERIRVGYASSNLTGHAGTSGMLGWLKHHDRSRFEVYCYHTGSDRTDVTEWIVQTSEVFRHIPNSLEDACRQIRGDRLHVLVYPDIGMNPKTTTMAALRLAPIQCMAWGHPVTSGLPTIDYYLSSDLMEPDDAEEHYTERLVRLPNLGFCYLQPEIPELTGTRAEFEIDQDCLMYYSCQSLYKYLPQYDYLFPAIAQRVPQARFVFLAHPSVWVTEQFRHRLEGAFAAYSLEAAEHFTILPRQDRAGYLTLHLLADVCLDTPGWAGGNTTLEALTCHRPVVTCPGRLMRGRHSRAMLRMLGLDELIARDAAEYIEIAVRLGLDPDGRHRLNCHIGERIVGLFEEVTPLIALERLFEQVVTGRGSLRLEGREPISFH